MSYWVWDSIIAALLMINLVLIIFLLKKARYDFATLCMLVFGLICYGSFIEPRLIVTTHKDISFSESTNTSTTIAFLTDLHVGPYKGEGFLDKVVEKTLEQEPDIVLLGGDYIYKEASAVKKLAPLRKLTEKLPVYAIMGNHDYNLYSATAPVDEELGQIVQENLETYGVSVLTNGGYYREGIYIAGVDDYWSRNVVLYKALASRTYPTQPTILLAHNPDMILDILPEHGIDLMLSGHTHGGQIRLPFIGPIGKIPTQLGQLYDQGLFKKDETQIYISSGLGESGPRARLFNPPEIVILTVHH